MSVLAVRNLTEVLVSLATNVILIIISIYVLYLSLRFLEGFLNGVNKNLERANNKGDSGPAVFWCIVFFLVYWFWFR